MGLGIVHSLLKLLFAARGKPGREGRRSQVQIQLCPARQNENRSRVVQFFPLEQPGADRAFLFSAWR
jgi:hypothetical protein